MCKLAHDEAQSTVSAVAEFAVAASLVQHEELRALSQRMALEGLKLCQDHLRQCIGFLKEVLRNGPHFGPEAMQEIVWMLYTVVRTSTTARTSAVELGAQEDLYAALLMFPACEDLLRHGVWLIYGLSGLHGFAELLKKSTSRTDPGHMAVRGQVAWCLYELVTKGDRDEGLMHPPPGHTDLLVLLAEAAKHKNIDSAALWACCKAMDKLVMEDNRLGVLFMDNPTLNGGPLLLHLIRTGRSLGVDGEPLRKAISYLIGSLAGCGTHTVAKLRADGLPQALVEDGLLEFGSSGTDLEATMWALGTLGGLSSVLQVMLTPNAPSAVLRGGVQALGDCAEKASDDPQEMQRLPTALHVVLEVPESGSTVKDRIRAIGSVAACIVPHAKPHSIPALDRGIQDICQRLEALPLKPPTEALPQIGDDQAGESSIRAACPIAGSVEAACEALGRVALSAPAWREALHDSGILHLFKRWIRSKTAPQKTQKYLFWAAAAIAGLPTVASELRQQMSSTTVVVAGLCTIIDILDEDISGEYSLTSVERGEETCMSILLGTVIEAMTAHASFPEVQARGAHCISLMVPHASREALISQASNMITLILTSARRFPRRLDVARGACSALRALCMLQTSEGCLLRLPCIDGPLSQQGAAECVETIVDSWRSGASNIDMLEDAFATLVMLLGPNSVLVKLQDVEVGSLLRVPALKALFEVCRAVPQLLDAQVSAVACEACVVMVAQEPAHEKLAQAANLLSGLCGGAQR